MGKTITLPLGMVIGDVSAIGDYAHISGQQYDATNIKLSEVRSVLSESTYNLGQLCLSSNINVWAAFKPWRRTNPDATDHGMIVVSHEFAYELPTDISGHALGHFAGYNDDSDTPYIVPTSIQEYYTVFPQTPYTIGIALYLPEFDVRDVDDGNIVNAYARTYNSVDALVYTDTVELTDGVIAAGYIQTYAKINIPPEGTTVNFTVKITLGDTLDVNNVYFPVDGGGEVIITGQLVNGNPTAVLALDSFLPDPTFPFPQYELFNPAAEVAIEGNSWIISFGQVDPAKGITEDGDEWGGDFNIYATDGEDIDVLVEGYTKAIDEYLWDDSGTFTNITVEIGSNIAFIIEKDI